MMRDQFLKYWFYGSTLLLAILWFIIDKRGRKIDKILSDVQFNILQQKLIDINEKARESDDSYNEAKKEYEDLKHTHGDLLNRIGVFVAPPSKK